MDECNPPPDPTRWTSLWIRSVPSWTRSPTSGTCLWSPTWIMGSPRWPTRWCPRQASSLHPAPERPASRTRAKTSKSDASPSNQRMWFREASSETALCVLCIKGRENSVSNLARRPQTFSKSWLVHGNDITFFQLSPTHFKQVWRAQRKTAQTQISQLKHPKLV